MLKPKATRSLLKGPVVEPKTRKGALLESSSANNTDTRDDVGPTTEARSSSLFPRGDTSSKYFAVGVDSRRIRHVPSSFSNVSSVVTRVERLRAPTPLVSATLPWPVHRNARWDLTRHGELLARHLAHRLGRHGD